MLNYCPSFKTLVAYRPSGLERISTSAQAAYSSHSFWDFLFVLVADASSHTFGRSSVAMEVDVRTGSALLLEVLSSEGIEYIFGNPGTTEMPIMHALKRFPEIQYVLGLQETAVVAMADGYAKASGKPAFVNLHTAGGLGHAMGALLHSRIARTPMLVTVGQQDTRHTFSDPLLYGDALGMAGPAVKWAREAHHPEHIPPLIRRGLQHAGTSPSGPVFVSLPIDVLTADTICSSGRPSEIRRRTLADGLNELACRLSRFKPGQLALIATDEVGAVNAGEDLVELAEVLGSFVYGPSWPGEMSFSPTHPLWKGNLPTTAAEIRSVLSELDAVFVVGDNPFISYQYSEGPAVPERCRLYQLSGDGNELGRTYATDLGCVGDLKRSLRALIPMVAAEMGPGRLEAAATLAGATANRQLRLAALSERIEAEKTIVPTTPFFAASAVITALDDDVIVVDEAPATIAHARALLEKVQVKRYFFMRSAILGWGLSAAVGVALGSKTRVVALIGDGSALYAPQGLWTAARLRLPITFVIMNNSEYNILKRYSLAQGYEEGGNSTIAGMEINNPSIDFTALATAFGITSQRVTSASEIERVVRRAVSSGQPNLVEIVIAAS
jgi:benzoylformate decarboxylase